MPECLFNPISNSDCACRPGPADGTTISFRCSLAPKSNLCQARWASQWATGPGAGGPSLARLGPSVPACGQVPGPAAWSWGAPLSVCDRQCASVLLINLPVNWSAFSVLKSVSTWTSSSSWSATGKVHWVCRFFQKTAWDCNLKVWVWRTFCRLFSSITDFCRLRLQVYEVCRGRVLRSELTTDFKTKSALSMRWVCIKSEESARVLHKVCIRSGCFSGENTLFWKVLTVTGCTLLKCQSVNCNAIYDAIISSWKLIYDLIFMCCKTNK